MFILYTKFDTFQTLQLIGNLLESFHELLEHADWMDDATRIVAREKVRF